MAEQPNAEVIVVGGGLAGLSAAIYLGRARRHTLVVDSGNSMAVWEPAVQNYLGFPDGIGGEELLARGRQQAERHGVAFAADEILDAAQSDEGFQLRGKQATYRARWVLLATGILHLPPDIPGVSECLGHSLFFCKDCDGFRVQGQHVAVLGRNDEAAEYALALLAYTPRVLIATNGEEAMWNDRLAGLLRHYDVPVHGGRIQAVGHEGCDMRSLVFEGGRELAVEAAFATRGDLYHSGLARSLGADLDASGVIAVNECLRTSVPRLFAAGCVTPANCQMIIAAGQGATAAQAINREIFEQQLASGSLARATASGDTEPRWIG